MINRNPCSYLSSTDNKKIHTGGRSLLCPHRSCTVIQIDRTANFLTIRKYHYHGHASSPCVTATHFVRSSRSIPLLQCNVSTFPHVHSYQRAGTSWRIYLVAPHILTSCMQKIFSCQGTGCIRSNQRMERDNANRLLCNFKSQYLCNQLCF